MLPLTDNGRIIDNGNRTIQIMKDMNDHYTKIVDNYDIAKMYLKLKTQHVSTVYPQHSIISRFIGGEEPNLPITDITKEMYKTDIIHFFPLVLERCISIVKNGERDSIFKVFKLLNLVDYTEREEALNKQKKREEQLIKHEEMEKELKGLKEKELEATNNKEELKEKIEELNKKKESLKQQIQDENDPNYRIYKSPLYLNSINHFISNTTDDGNYLCLILQSTFPKIFDCSKETAEERSIVGVKLYDSLRTISNFIIYCADNGINASLVREANMYYAEFIPFDDHLDALALVKNLNQRHTQLMRIEFISVMAESDHLYQINGPQSLEIKEINKLNDQLAQRHALFFVILRQYFLLTLSPDLLISRLSLTELLVIMNKYDLDVLFQSQSERDKFFNMVFPFVLFMLDDSEKINDWREKECVSDLYDIESLYVIFFFILKNLREEIIQQWLVSDFLSSLLYSLLTHIRKALLLFSKYQYCIVKTFLTQNYDQYCPQILLLNHGDNLSHSTGKSSPQRSPKAPQTPTHIKNSAASLRASIKFHKPDNQSAPETPKKDRGINPFLESFRIDKSTLFTNERTMRPQTSRETHLFDSIDSDVLTKTTVKVGDDLVTDIALIAMDFIETTIGILIREEKTKALERAEEIISSVLFGVPLSSGYLLNLYEFIRSTIVTYPTFIFTTQNTLAPALMKNLLNLSNSENSSQRDFAINLIFIFAKTNFITCGNTVATIVNATSALSELNLKSVDLISASIKSLPQLAIKYHEYFDVKLQKCIENSLVEGIRRMKSLQRVHKLYKAIDAGDMDAFIAFVSNVINMYHKVIDFAIEAEPSILNGYVALKHDLISMIKNNTIYQEISTTISFIEKKVSTTNKSFLQFLTHKTNTLKQRFEECSINIDKLEKLCIENERDMQSLEKMCIENKAIGERVIEWIRKSVIVNRCNLENLSDVELIHRIDVLEKEQASRSSESNKMLEEYTSFDTTLQQYSLEKNPLFPITSEEMSESIRKVIQLHQLQIHYVNRYLKAKTLYVTSKERYNQSVQNYQTIIQNQFSDICNMVESTPLSAPFLSECIVKTKTLHQQYNSYVTKLDDKTKNMDGLVSTWEIDYSSWENSINQTIVVVDCLKELTKKVTENEKEVTKMKNWYEKERYFVQTTITTYLWEHLYNALNGVETRESNDFLSHLVKTSNYLSDNVEDVKVQFLNATTLLTFLKKTKEPIGSDFLASINDSCFELLPILTENYALRWADEIKRETIRKEYAKLFEEFYQVSDKLLDNASTTVESINEVENLRDKLIVYEEMNIDKLNIYCNLEQSDQTVWARCISLGISDKEPRYPTGRDTPSPASHTQTLISRSPSLPNTFSNTTRKSRRNEEVNRELVGFFMDREENMRSDCFFDLSYGQRSAFGDDLRDVQTDVIQILDKIKNLDDSKSSLNDPQHEIESHYQFAMDYVSAPRLHLTLIKKTAERHRNRKQHIEAGLCEVYMILFIHHILPSTTVHINVEPLQKAFGEFAPKLTIQPNPQFIGHITEEEVLAHMTNAIIDFKNGGLPWHGLIISQCVIPYYIQNHCYKELQEKHDYVKEMYSQVSKLNPLERSSSFIDFYFVRFFGNAYNYLNQSSFIYAITPGKNVELLVEIKHILPQSFNGERHMLRSLDQITDAVLNPPNDQSYCLWTKVTPTIEYGSYIQYTNNFFYDELVISGDAQTQTIKDTPITQLNIKRTVFTTKHFLPSILKRYAVENEKVVVLTAIDVIIEEVILRRKKVTFYLSDVKKSIESTGTNILDKLEETINNFFRPIAKTPTNRFHLLKAIDICDTFFADLNLWDKKKYFTLLDELKLATIACEEGLTFISTNSVTKTSSATFDVLERQFMRVQKLVSDIEKFLTEKLN
ncbi:EF-hand domain-containing protein [Entamoeba marina]